MGRYSLMKAKQKAGPKMYKRGVRKVAAKKRFGLVIKRMLEI